MNIVMCRLLSHWRGATARPPQLPVMRRLLVSVCLVCLCWHAHSFLTPPPVAPLRLRPLRSSCSVPGLAFWSFSSAKCSTRDVGCKALDPNGASQEEEDEDWKKLARVFVVIFNPRTDNEGIHSLQLRDEDGIMRNTILLFQEEDDALRFGGLLEAQEFPPAHVEAMPPDEILSFVEDAGYECSFVPGDMLFMPPETNVAREDMPWKEDSESYDAVEATEDDSIDYDEARRRLQDLFNP